jgi:hypothetical protein
MIQRMFSIVHMIHHIKSNSNIYQILIQEKKFFQMVNSLKACFTEKIFVFFFSIELSSILDETFIEESNKRDLLNNLSLPIQIKTQLLPISKSRSNISTNFFDMVCSSLVYLKRSFLLVYA